MDRTDFLVYRIMKGHLSFRRDGLSLFIVEPDPDMMFESIAIYEEAYDRAYSQGVYIKDEITELLTVMELFNHFDEMELENLKKDAEEFRLQCYKNFTKSKELSASKFALRQTEEKITTLNRKKYQFDHATCEGLAVQAQWNWIIEHSTYFSDGTIYDWKKFPVSTLMSHYEASVISSPEYRTMARSDIWRPIWNLGKKTGNLFNRPSTLLTRDQLALCSYSTMYDSVYESPDAPPDKVIEDDDCLDGWFIDQKRKNEQYKKQKEADEFLANKKIANAGEVFIMAKDDKEAAYIDSYNTAQSRGIKAERMATVKGKDLITDLQFRDIQTDIQVQQNEKMFNQVRGR